MMSSKFPSVEVIVVETTERCRAVSTKIRKHCAEYPVLGFDCEKPQMGKVALLQLATAHRLCVLIRLSKGFVVPKELRDILADRDIIKVGVAPLNDARDLQRDHNLTVNGTLDLRFRAVEFNTEPGSLAKLADRVLGVQIQDGLPHSNWEQYSLDDRHIEYAANDAIAALEIFRKLGGTSRALRNLDLEFQSNHHSNFSANVYRWS